jgi:hypothetical protein
MVFQPGQCGNPAGRPKGSVNKPKEIVPPKTAREKMRDAVLLAREATPEAVAKLVSLMRHGDNDQIKLAAANAILDRGLGKPTQPVDVSFVKQIGQMSLDELIELEAKIASLPMALPALIEHQPEQHQDTVAEPVSAPQTDIIGS